MPWVDSRLHVHERCGHGKRHNINDDPSEHQANRFRAPLSQVLEHRASPRLHDKQLPGSTASLTDQQADTTSEQLTVTADGKVLPVALTDSSMGAASASKGRSIHTLCTSNGSPYLNYQTRIMYGTYQMIQKAAGGDQHVAFTRILHRSEPDILMTQVPSFRADPLTPACDTWCEFPVSDRPNAVRQFFDAAVKDASLIQAPWLLMIETDYVWMKPLQAPQAEDMAASSLAFPFGYINPQYPNIEGVMRKMYPAEKGPLTNVPGSGPAPVMMRLAEWIKVTPDWERLTAHIEADPESKEKLGWVREMYAFSVALALQGIKVDLAKPPLNPLITQPPADATLGQAAMFHYTWGSVFQNAQGEKAWEFDKRAYTDPSIVTTPPALALPPAFDTQFKLQDGKAVTQELYDTLTAMIQQMNHAIANLSPLKDTITATAA
ncbi:TPA: hypothetical protein ACH3X2_007228 [Trebouxia sp. C0005]